VGNLFALMISIAIISLNFPAEAAESSPSLVCEGALGPLPIEIVQLRARFARHSGLHTRIRWTDQRYFANNGMRLRPVSYLSPTFYRELKTYRAAFLDIRETHQLMVAELVKLMPEIGPWTAGERMNRADLRWRDLVDQFEELKPRLLVRASEGNATVHGHLGASKIFLKEAERVHAVIEGLKRWRHPGENIRVLMSGAGSSSFLLWARDVLSLLAVAEVRPSEKDFLRFMDQLMMEIVLQFYSIGANGYDHWPQHMAAWQNWPFQIMGRMIPETPLFTKGLRLINSRIEAEEGDKDSQKIELVKLLLALPQPASNGSSSLPVVYDEKIGWEYLVRLADFLNSRTEYLLKREFGFGYQAIIGRIISDELKRMQRTSQSSSLSEKERGGYVGRVLRGLAKHWMPGHTYLLSRIYWNSMAPLSLPNPADILASTSSSLTLDMESLESRFDFKTLSKESNFAYHNGVMGSTPSSFANFNEYLNDTYADYLRLVTDVLSTPAVSILLPKLSPVSLDLAAVGPGVQPDYAEVLRELARAGRQLAFLLDLQSQGRMDEATQGTYALLSKNASYLEALLLRLGGWYFSDEGNLDQQAFP